MHKRIPALLLTLSIAGLFIVLPCFAATPAPTSSPAPVIVCCEVGPLQHRRVPSTECAEDGGKSVPSSACDYAEKKVCCQTHPDACQFEWPRESCLRFRGVETSGPCTTTSRCCYGPVEGGIKMAQHLDPDETIEGCCLGGGVMVDDSHCASPSPTGSPKK